MSITIQQFQDQEALEGLVSGTMKARGEDWRDFFAVTAAEANRHLKDVPDGASFDEVALLARNESMVEDLLNSFLCNGLGIVFNRSVDVVNTYPFKSRYEVEYTFLKPYGYDFRIEVMRLLPGQVSPLHAPFSQRASLAQGPVPVHLSWKTLGLTGFQQTVDWCQESVSGENVLVHAMTCQSTYGKFCYFRPVEGVYLKPRVNLRDAS